MSFKNKKKCKYLECFGPVTEGITLLSWKGIIKHYIEDLIFQNFDNKKSLKNSVSGQK